MTHTPPRHATPDDTRWMRRALEIARAAERAGEVPVGAIVVVNGEEIAASGNRTLRDQDATAHAETLAIRDACAAAASWRLDQATLYVTLEPCAMCAGAIVLARIQRVVFGAWDDKAGMAGSVEDLLRHRRLNHRAGVTAGILAEECGALLREFFQRRRAGSAPGDEQDAGSR